MSYTPEKIRNIAVVGHQGSGKTTLVEALAYMNGTIAKQGSVEKGDTISDYLPYEREKKVSIASSLVSVKRGDYLLNLIDLPGNDDFIFETIGVTRLVKGAIIVIDAAKGVQNGTIKAFKMLHKRGVPMFIFINKMDKDEVDFPHLFTEIQERLGGQRCVPFSYPIGRREKFDGFVNIVELKARRYNGRTCEDDEIFEEKRPIVFQLHNRLCEAVASVDDQLLEKFFSGETLTNEEIKIGLRRAVLDGELFPVLVGSAAKDIGLNTLSTMLIDYLPSPADLKPITALDTATHQEIQISTSLDEPASLQIFKNSYSAYLGTISTFKVQSGRVKLNDTLICPNNGKQYRIAQLYRPCGAKLTPVEEIGAGDIGATTKLEDLKLSYTLAALDRPVEFKPVSYPTPTYFIGIVPSTKKDSDKLFPAVAKIAIEDPTIALSKDETTHQITLGGMTKTHLAYIEERLRNEYGIHFTTEPIRISYRETITATASAEGRYIKQTGGAGYYGVVEMRFEPSESISFASEVSGGHVDKGYFPAVDKGFREALEKGGLIGAPVIGVRAILVDGKQHSVDSNEMAFKNAAILAFRNAYDKLHPILLEPFYQLTVSVPNEFLGNVLSDLARRRGRIISSEENSAGDMEVVAIAPEAEITDYANEIKGLAKGMGFFNMVFSDYEPVPEKIAGQVIEQYQDRT